MCLPAFYSKELFEADKEYHRTCYRKGASDHHGKEIGYHSSQAYEEYGQELHCEFERP